MANFASTCEYAMNVSHKNWKQKKSDKFRTSCPAISGQLMMVIEPIFERSTTKMLL